MGYFKIIGIFLLKLKNRLIPAIFKLLENGRRDQLLKIK